MQSLRRLGVFAATTALAGTSLVPTPLEQPSDKAFLPEIVTVCAFSEDGDEGLTYVELEMSSTGGGGSGGGGEVLGSLADLSGSLGS